MNEFAVITGVILAITCISFYRLIRGPRAFNRLLATGAIGANAIAIMALLGFIFDRPDMFVDLALTYALLNFIGTVAVAKYLENHPQEAETEADVTPQEVAK